MTITSLTLLWFNSRALFRSISLAVCGQDTVKRYFAVFLLVFVGKTLMGAFLGADDLVNLNAGLE